MNKNKYKTICLIILSCYIFMGCSWSKYEIDNNEKYEEKRDTEAGITEDTKITQESEEKYQDYISAKKKDEIEIDSESLELYEAFISGNASAKFVKEGDSTHIFNLSNALQDGERYSLAEMEQRICDNCDVAEKWVYENNVSESYIDAGLDDQYEMKLDIGAATLNMTIIVKNIGGELEICFVGDSNERSKTDVLYSGEVQYTEIIDNDSHKYERGYIDADGNYKFWVQYKEDSYNIGESEDLYYNEKYIGTNIGMYVQEFSFNRDFSDSFYSIGLVDKENNHIEEDNTDPNNPYEIARNLFTEEGKIILSREEAKKQIDKHRKEIGYDDKLYNYGSHIKQ